MPFKTIHTNHGLAAMAAAEASGIPIALTHMAVGDGNGNPVTPVASQTALVREMYRATVNRVYQYPDEPARFVAELVVPATEGGFVLREVGVFDVDGNLFAVGNLPDTYKPTDEEGAFSDCIIRMEFIVSNADVVTLQVDPNVAVATQTWIINNVTGASLIPGGTTGQVLTKDSNADGDFSWHDPTDVNVVVNTIEEEQTLADGQTEINWATVNNTGLAIYVEGVRLSKVAGAAGWQPHGSIVTRSILGQSYPAGTKVIGVQNEPASNLPDALESSQNLSDVASASAARANLDVYSKAESDIICPPSAVMHFARSTAPSGWLKCDGAAINRTTYARLFAAIGTAFGAGDGFNTFNVPDLRGEFIRGWSSGRAGVDTSRVFGSSQLDALQNITGTLQVSNSGLSTGGAFARDGATQLHIDANTIGSDPTITFDASRVARTAAETRPRNVAMLACIRF